MNYKTLTVAKWAVWNGYKNKENKEMKEKNLTSKYKDIITTDEDMVMVRNAARYHACYASRKGKYTTTEELLGLAYEGLLAALFSYDEKKIGKDYNRERYLLTKMKFYMLDAHRNVHGRKNNKYKHNPLSLDFVVNENGDCVGDIVQDKSVKQPEDEIYERQVCKIVEKIFLDMTMKRKNDWAGSDLFELLMLRMEGQTLKQLSILMDCSEGRMTQLFLYRINPVLAEIKEQLQESI